MRQGATRSLERVLRSATWALRRWCAIASMAKLSNSASLCLSALHSWIVHTALEVWAHRHATPAGSGAPDLLRSSGNAFLRKSIECRLAGHAPAHPPCMHAPVVRCPCCAIRTVKMAYLPTYLPSNSSLQRVTHAWVEQLAPPMRVHTCVTRCRSRGASCTPELRQPCKHVFKETHGVRHTANFGFCTRRPHMDTPDYCGSRLCLL